MGRWVQIRRYHLREGVLVERTLLESTGILVWSPDEAFYATFPPLADSSSQGYRLFVIDSDLKDAREILAQRDETQVSYPCPKGGGKTRRLKSISGTIAVSFLFILAGGPIVWPIRRRMRICVENRHRFMPEAPEPFTAEELGYPPTYIDRVSLKESFLRFLAWTRSIGYEKRDDEQEEPREK